MQSSDLKIGLWVALGVLAVWLVVDGTVLYTVAALMFAGVVPFTGYIIPAHSMLLFWLFCAGLAMHYISRPRVAAFIASIETQRTNSAQRPAFYAAARSSRPLSTRRRIRRP